MSQRNPMFQKRTFFSICVCISEKVYVFWQWHYWIFDSEQWIISHQIQKKIITTVKKINHTEIFQPVDAERCSWVLYERQVPVFILLDVRDNGWSSTLQYVVTKIWNALHRFMFWMLGASTLGTVLKAVKHFGGGWGWKM